MWLLLPRLYVQGHDPKKIRDGLRAALGRDDAPSGTEPQSAGLIVTAHTVAEVLSGWVGVPAEGLLENQ